MFNTKSNCKQAKLSIGGLKTHKKVVNKTKELHFVYKICQPTKVKL